MKEKLHATASLVSILVGISGMFSCQAKDKQLKMAEREVWKQQEMIEWQSEQIKRGNR